MRETVERSKIGKREASQLPELRDCEDLGRQRRSQLVVVYVTGGGAEGLISGATWRDAAKGRTRKAARADLEHLTVLGLNNQGS